MTLRRRTILAAFAACTAFGGLAVALTTCGRQPSGAATTFSHDAVAGQACSQCHAPIRPGPYLSYPHGNDLDCAVCHLPKDVPATGTDSPDSTLWLPRRAYDHDSQKPTACMPCHDTERPTPQADPNHPGPPADCVGCHNGQWSKGSFTAP